MATSQSTLKKQKQFPVTEIFGPTIQGEGIDQGVPCHFIRFGGCDYRCDWCDSLFAVLPQHVRHADRLSAIDIVTRISHLAQGPKWIILSGGNPVLHELGDLVTELHTQGFLVSVETQGTKWKDWLWRCDRIAISPKPPSSDQRTEFDLLDRFINNVPEEIGFLKVVVFDQRDYFFAKEIHDRYPDYPMIVSAGNDAGATVGNPTRTDNRHEHEIARDLIDKGRWLANVIMVDPMMHDVRIQMQQHVLFWGNERGR